MKSILIILLIWLTGCGSAAHSQPVGVGTEQTKQTNSTCSEPTEGCPCSVGEVADCKSTRTSPSGYQSCSVGKITCTNDAKWSSCAGGKVAN